MREVEAMRSAEEWIKQADYDLETAEYMLRGGRNMYAVFMCHLSLEKALKGVYQKVLQEEPPRTHSLTLLVARTGLNPNTEQMDFIIEMTQTSVITRYPEDLAKMQKALSKKLTHDILVKSREMLQWIKQQLLIR